MPVLTFLDTLRIQPFVFASNRLKDVVGGSWLVRQATARDGWVTELGYENRVLVGGGGNLLLRFDGNTEAKDFAARFSRCVLDRAPGLEVVIAHRSYSSGQLAPAIGNVLTDIERCKLERQPSVPVLGLGVTAACRQTRLPAIHSCKEDDYLPVAASVRARRDCRGALDQWWHRFLPTGWSSFSVGGSDPIRLAFPQDLDDLGRSPGDTSLIGVVHIDGNAVGKKIKKWLQDQHTKPDAKVDVEYRAISGGLDKLAREVLVKLVERTAAAVRWDPNTRSYEVWSKLGKAFRLRSESDVVYLPLRPVLCAGDDLTFVCDGRIALDLASRALELFQSQSVPAIGKVGACAGIALVKSHAPFARAYDLAEELCLSAKKFLRAKNREHESALDWHIGLPSTTESLDDIRERQYQDQAGNVDLRLTCRPYPLGGGSSPPPEPTWRWLTTELLAAEGNGFHGARWRDHRAKIKSLPEIARGGPDDVARALKAWEIAAHSLKLPSPIEKGFWGARKTPLLDAIELLDVHLPLG